MRNQIAQLRFLMTKPSGIGVGHSICRPIVENRGAALHGSRNGDTAAAFRRWHQEALP